MLTNEHSLTTATTGSKHMSDEADDKPSAVRGEYFLTGPTVYLRGIEPDDTKSMIAWNPSPYPIPADLALENLEKEVPADAEWHEYRLVACRRSDNRAVGSIRFESEDQRTCWLTVY